MESVYLETTVIGHLVGRIHPDPVIAGRQLSTRRWWEVASSQYHLFVSQMVIEECSGGNAIAAKERLEVLQAIGLIEGSPEANGLAIELTSRGAIPPTEPRDALHIAIAAVGRIQYLLTWNFKHIANPAMRRRIEEVCRAVGFEPPQICTPDELLGADDGT